MLSHGPQTKENPNDEINLEEGLIVERMKQRTGKEFNNQETI